MNLPEPIKLIGYFFFGSILGCGAAIVVGTMFMVSIKIFINIMEMIF